MRLVAASGQQCTTRATGGIWHNGSEADHASSTKKLVSNLMYAIITLCMQELVFRTSTVPGTRVIGDDLRLTAARQLRCSGWRAASTLRAVEAGSVPSLLLDFLRGFICQ